MGSAVSPGVARWAAAAGAPATVSHRATRVARQTGAMVLQVGDRDDDRAGVHAGLGRGGGAHGAADPEVDKRVRGRPEPGRSAGNGVEGGGARYVVRAVPPGRRS